MSTLSSPRCSCWVGCALEPRPCLYCSGEGCTLCEDGETLACPRCYLVAQGLLAAGVEWDASHTRPRSVTSAPSAMTTSADDFCGPPTRRNQLGLL